MLDSPSSSESSSEEFLQETSFFENREKQKGQKRRKFSTPFIKEEANARNNENLDKLISVKQAIIKGRKGQAPHTGPSQSTETSTQIIDSQHSLAHSSINPP